MSFPILSLLILLPLAAALWVLLVPVGADHRACHARWVSLIASLVVFVASLVMWAHFDSHQAQFQFVEKYAIFAPYFHWDLGIDGISLMLILLSTLLTPICILASWTSIKDRVPEFMAAFLAMESLVIGVFCANDLFLFYLLFEGGLIPMYFIIGIWGGARRIYASYKFFLYTLLGSVLMLLAMLFMVGQTGTTSIPALMNYHWAADVQNWLWLAFFASFAVKMPMWPVHTWLPDAHVEAPTAGSVLLAGVLLKLGGYGMLRFSLPMFPEASVHFMWLVFGLSMVAVVYTSLVALVQEDMKKLIAYSSVAHMAFVTAGLFVFNTQGIEGAIFTMLSHGVVSAALFLCVGVVYDRLHTREIARYGGLAQNMPKYATFFMLFTMASVGLPMTSGFVGEFLVLVGAFQTSSLLTFVMLTGIILGAAYALYLYRRVVFGALEKPDLQALKDVSWREIGILAPLAALTLIMGVYPKPFLDPLQIPVSHLVARLSQATATHHKEKMVSSHADAEVQHVSTH